MSNIYRLKHKPNHTLLVLSGRLDFAVILLLSISKKHRFEFYTKTWVFSETSCQNIYRFNYKLNHTLLVLSGRLDFVVIMLLSISKKQRFVFILKHRCFLKLLVKYLSIELQTKSYIACFVGMIGFCSDPVVKYLKKSKISVFILKHRYFLKLLVKYLSIELQTKSYIACFVGTIGFCRDPIVKYLKKSKDSCFTLKHGYFLKLLVKYLSIELQTQIIHCLFCRDDWILQ